MIKKIILTLACVLILFSTTLLPFVASSAKAQSSWYSQDFRSWYTKVFDEAVSPPAEIFGERYTAAQVQWVIYGLISVIVNKFIGEELFTCILNADINSCWEANPLAYNNSSIDNPSEDKSVLATLFPQNRSLSGVNYVRQKIDKFSLVPEAKAQGFGFGALSPVQHIWRVFRDATYAIFVLIVIVMAFMIMFRYKLSPQTVVTVQSALPRVVITLILVTFSYAIAGLLLDFTYVVIGLIALVFQNSGVFPNATWGDVFGMLTDGPNVGGLIGWGFLILPMYFTGIFGFMLGPDGISSIWELAGAGIPIIIGLILGLILVAWTVYIFFRVFLTLVRAFISILILVIFAPLQIGIGAILPSRQGSETGFSGWVRSLVANLAVYPVTGALFMITVLLLSASQIGFGLTIRDRLGLQAVASPFACTSGSCEFWYPPLTVGTQSGSYDPVPFLFAIASLGVLASIPKAADMIKSAMERGSAGFGGAMMAGLAAIPGAARVTPGIRGRIKSYEAFRDAKDRFRMQEGVSRLERLKRSK